MSIRRSAPWMGALLLSASIATAQEAPTLEEMWAIVQQQQAEIEALRGELAEARAGMEATDEKVAETDAKIEATGDVIETMAIADTSPTKTHIGGYGELHYNKISADAGDSSEIDYHRFVLYFNHDFTDRIRFYSELELEHSLAGDGKPGEVELEQAFVEYALTDNTYARTGLFLLPIGIINETHEPPTFYGVERNSVENVITPTTWWEAGAGARMGWGDEEYAAAGATIEDADAIYRDKDLIIKIKGPSMESIDRMRPGCALLFLFGQGPGPTVGGPGAAQRIVVFGIGHQAGQGVAVLVIGQPAVG